MQEIAAGQTIAERDGTLGVQTQHGPRPPGRKQDRQGDIYEANVQRAGGQRKSRRLATLGCGSLAGVVEFASVLRASWRTLVPTQETPEQLTLRDSLSALTVDHLKPLVRLIDGNVLGRKNELVERMAEKLGNHRAVQAFYEQLDDLSQKAVQEATYDPDGVLHFDRFAARYGSRPHFGGSGVYPRDSPPTLLRLFFPGYRVLPIDLRRPAEDLRAPAEAAFHSWRRGTSRTGEASARPSRRVLPSAGRGRGCAARPGHGEGGPVGGEGPLAAHRRRRGQGQRQDASGRQGNAQNSRPRSVRRRLLRRRGCIGGQRRSGV